MNKLISIESEIKRLARAFAEQQNIRIEVFFNRPPGEKYSEEWLRANGLHKGVPGGLHKLYINLDREDNSRSLIFRTLAHELAHTLQQETEGKHYSKKHNFAFWKTLDDYTLPFVLENLAKEDREGLANLLNPTTNQAEENDWVHLEAEEGIITITVEPENIDRQWRIIRQETIKGNLGLRTFVSTKRISQSKHWLTIHVVEKEIDQVVERLRELGFSETDMKIKRPWLT